MLFIIVSYIFISSFNENAFNSLFPFLTEQFLPKEYNNTLYYYLILLALYNIGKICGFKLWKCINIKIKTIDLISCCFLLSTILWP